MYVIYCKTSTIAIFLPKHQFFILLLLFFKHFYTYIQTLYTDRNIEPYKANLKKAIMLSASQNTQRFDFLHSFMVCRHCYAFQLQR